MEKVTQKSALIKNLLDLLEGHREAFEQERTFLRVVGLVVGEVGVFTRHTVTQLLVVLGLYEADWSAWYRLFSRRRFAEERVAAQLLRETLAHVGPDEVYVVGGDGTQIARDSRKMEGSGWLKCPRNPVFKRSIHRAQRFFHGAWLLPPEEGYSRALPLRMLPAFPEKAVHRAHAAVTEWQAGLTYLGWVREQLVQAGRATQPVLGVFDGSFETLGWWKGLPPGVVTLVRTAKNRVLYERYSGPDRRRKYGPRAPAPEAWMRQRKGWQTCNLTVRGRKRRVVYRVAGPYVREGVADVPLFLIVIRGHHYLDRGGRRRYREAIPYLIPAQRADDGSWQLPLPIETLLFWAWQRWELEVTHREMKTDFGVGDKQCWHPVSAVASVQWGAWVYALLVLAGYRTLGLRGAPPCPTAWWRGARRWSFARLVDQYRVAFSSDEQYAPSWPAFPANWGDKQAVLADYFVQRRT